MTKKLFNILSVSNVWYSTYKKEITLVSNIQIKNKQLYQELEHASKAYDGYLTYAEFLSIEQFGNHGFYASSNLHGTTDVETRWGDALANYCKQNGHNTIIEFGCGTGELGIASAQAFKKKTGKYIKWFGVEIDEKLHKSIIRQFTKYNVQPSIEKIVTTLDTLPPIRNAVIVFPYSLDNIPPLVFLNTKTQNSYPDSLLGITVKDGSISETLIPPEVLQKKNISLVNGIFTQNNVSFKLTGWKLRKGQRAFIATDAYATLYAYAKKYADATFFIIDEFGKEPWMFSFGNVGTPKSLYEKNMTRNDLKRYYRESGKHNFYYPLYKDSILKFLSVIGFQSLVLEIEQRKASQLSGKSWISIAKSYSTYAFIAKDFTDKKVKVLPIPSPPKRIF